MATASIYYEILQSVQTRIQNVAGAPTVVLRRKLKLFSPRVDGDTLLIVAPGRGGEQINDEAFEGQVIWRYPVVVALIQPGDDQETDTLLAHMTLRESVRNILYQIYLDITGANQPFDIHMDTSEVQDLQAELGTSYEVTGWQVYYDVEEVREGPPG